MYNTYSRTIRGSGFMRCEYCVRRDVNFVDCISTGIQVSSHVFQGFLFSLLLLHDLLPTSYKHGSLRHSSININSLSSAVDAILRNVICDVIWNECLQNKWKSCADTKNWVTTMVISSSVALSRIGRYDHSVQPNSTQLSSTQLNVQNFKKLANQLN